MPVVFVLAVVAGRFLSSSDTAPVLDD